MRAVDDCGKEVFLDGWMCTVSADYKMMIYRRKPSCAAYSKLNIEGRAVVLSAQSEERTTFWYSRSLLCCELCTCGGSATLT
jgi:hypothetical protein